MGSLVKSIDKLTFPFKAGGPFLFCAFHRDLYPAGNEKMEAPRRGNGADFDWSKDYRMYHGENVPGFPQHPHRGFETITLTTEGHVDHSDSLGNKGRFGKGDGCFMTAGSGIVHGEMFPLVYSDKPNPLTLFQIWLNLPKNDKMAPPTFVMHWNERVPIVNVAPGVSARLYAGSLMDKTALDPPPHSWANVPGHRVGVFLVDIAKGADPFVLPASAPSVSGELFRCLYFYEGGPFEVDSQSVAEWSRVEVDGLRDVTIANKGETPAKLLVLQGEPINEPVAQHGPFVMNTRQELQDSFAEFQKTRFGGWPWPEDAMIFPRDAGRFASLNGERIVPPE